MGVCDLGNTKKQNFIQGASILMVSMIIVKVVGAVFKIPLTNVLDATGMAYFNSSYQLFTTIYALTVTGLASAVARMVAACSTKGRYRDCRKILRTVQIIFISLGLFGALLMLVFSRGFSSLIEMENARYAIMAMAPTIIFSCMMASYRGYYEGLRNMTPTAVSQVVEVICKLIVGLLFAYAVIAYAKGQFHDTGMVFGTKVLTESDAVSIALPFAAAGAMLGISFSTLAGFLYMLIHYRRSGDGITKEELRNSPPPVRTKAIVFTLIKTALPITLSSVALTLTNLIDVMTVSNRLQSTYLANQSFFDNLYGQYLGAGQEMHTFLYGTYTTALTYFSLVSAFTSLFGKIALPNITSAWVDRDRKSLKTNMESILRMTALIAFPAGIGISVLSRQIIMLFHGSKPGLVAATPDSLRLLGIAAIFLAFTTPIYAILQGVGRFDLPLKFIMIGAFIKITTNFIMVGIPQLNVTGAAIGSFLCYFTIVVLCLVWLTRITGVHLSYFKILGKPLIGALACGGTAYLVSQISDSKLITIASIAAAGAVYVVIILLIRAVPKSDILMMPKGAKIAALMEKLHLL